MHHVELSDQDGRVVSVVALDDRGMARAVKGNEAMDRWLIDRKLYVTREWADANGGEKLPDNTPGVVFVSPFDGEIFLRAFVDQTQTGYLNAAVVTA